MKSVLITVDEQGEVRIEAVGFRGSSCKKATEALERAMGTVKASTKKPEYYLGNEQGQKIGQG